MTESDYGPADLSTPRLKRHYQRWQRRAWRWSRKPAGGYRPGPAGNFETGAAHYAYCRNEASWAAANLKRRGWFIA